MKLRALVFVCALALATFTPALAAGASEAPLYYVSLGDSLAAGTQPDLAHPGTNIPFTNQSYTDQLFAIERAKLPTLQHVKLACPGETTGTMIADGLAFPGVGVVEGRNPHELCQYVHGSQLAEAVSFLHAHQNFVAFVTIDIGANDVLNLGPTGGAAAIAANLPVILAALRDAAPGVRVIGMNYYDPRLVTWFINPAGLQSEVNAAVGFNNFLESIYAAAGDGVADVEAAFDTTITTPVGGIPLDVLRICTWTWMCSVQNIHANVTGYHVIALAFAAKL